LRNLEDELVSKEELIRLAIKLREDLFNCEDKIGSSRAFAELMCSANALIVAIVEPGDFCLPLSLHRDTARTGPFPGGRRSIPISLH